MVLQQSILLLKSLNTIVNLSIYFKLIIILTHIWHTFDTHLTHIFLRSNYKTVKLLWKKTQKSHPKSFINLTPPFQNKSLSFLGVVLVKQGITHNLSTSNYLK
jgi:hypothetical protein